MLVTQFALALSAASVGVTAYPAFASGRSLVIPNAPIPRHVLRRAAAPYSPQFNYTGRRWTAYLVRVSAASQYQRQAMSSITIKSLLPALSEDHGEHIRPLFDRVIKIERGRPGLNTLASHGFISPDGIATYTELIAAMQNAYNMGFSAAVILAVLGVGYVGDPVTEMLSIGGDAINQTGAPGASSLGSYGGLSRHGTFELDASLTRDDFFLNGDGSTFNTTPLSLAFR